MNQVLLPSINKGKMRSELSDYCRPEKGLQRKSVIITTIG